MTPPKNEWHCDRCNRVHSPGNCPLDRGKPTQMPPAPPKPPAEDDELTDELCRIRKQIRLVTEQIANTNRHVSQELEYLRRRVSLLERRLSTGE